MFEFIKNIFKRKKDNKMENQKDTNKTISNKEIELLIEEFLGSEAFKSMTLGENYYMGKHDILKRKICGIDDKGNKVEIPYAPNNKIVDNMFKRFLDQKTNYLLSKEPTFTSDNDTYNELISEVFDDEFLKTLFLLCKNAYKYGVSWLYVYYNKDSKLCFKTFDSKGVIPIWTDSDHKELEKVIRLFKTKKFNGRVYEEITNVEVYSIDGIKSYTYDGARLSGLISDEPYIKLNEKAYNWTKLPIIPFKANELEQPLITQIKTLQDNINLTLSDFRNELSNTQFNKVLVVHNYDGEPGTFRYNLNGFGFVKVRSGGGDVGKGGIDTIDMEISVEKYKVALEQLRQSLIENAKGFDSKNDRLGANPNQMNIQTMYSDIDLDANSLEREFKESIKRLLWFINQHYMLLGKGNFEDVTLNIVFNRDMLINESQVIEDCVKSLAILSKESVIAQHPYVTDVELEIKRIKEEMATTDDYDDYIPKKEEKNEKDGE